MVKFHKTLSDRSVHLRYFGLVSLERRIMHERLRRVCFIDYDREIALVADLKNRDGTHQILGVGRLIKEHGTDEAEFAVLISDPWQGKGFGSELLKLLVQVGRKERLHRITGRISPENTAMKQVSEEVGFSLHFDEAEARMESGNRPLTSCSAKSHSRRSLSSVRLPNEQVAPRQSVEAGRMSTTPQSMARSSAAWFVRVQD